MNDTMHHLPEGVLQAHLDGELPIQEAARVERHLSGCAECARELELLRSGTAELSRALRVLDVTPTEVPSIRVVRADYDAARAAPPTRGGWKGWAALPRAAVLVFGVAAAAAAAIPGSPVRGWIESLLDEREAGVMQPSGPVAETSVDAPAAESGVSVAPEAGEARVMIEEFRPGVEVVVRLTGGERVGAYVTGDGTVRFATGRGRITVSGASDGELRVEIPAHVTNAVVELNGALYVVKDQDRLRLVGGDSDSTGREVSFTVR